MMRSLYSGVSGLKAHQTKMDVIGNNIANVNTTAFKSQSITFSELMYQTTQAASGANAETGRAGTNARQIGLGVTTGAISTSIETTGATQSTGNPFDLKITGEALFIVSNGQDTFFTRDGSFYVDGQGNLAMTSNGYTVQGWQVRDGNIAKDTVSALRIMSAENMTYPPEATTEAYVSGIIDKNDPSVSSEAGKIVSVNFFDSLGYAYTAKLSMKATGTEGMYTVELADVLDSNGDAIDTTNIQLGAVKTVEDAQNLTLANGYTINGTTLTYLDDAGNSQNINLAGELTAEQQEIVANAYGYTTYEEFAKLYIANPDGTTTTLGALIEANNLASAISPDDGSIAVAGKQITGGVVQYNTSTGQIQSVNGLTNNLELVLSFGDEAGSAFEDINIDFSPSSNYNNNGTSTISAVSGDTDGLGAGRKLGEMSGVSIQNDGMIYASYDNGQTKLLGQIAVATFANASGLQKEGDNLYSATMNSGEFDGIGLDVTADGGYMTTGVLEMSNVDLSSEFTEMITTQRGFQANSRIITVSDTLLEELVNLKR
ncbi:MAG: flagellar hook-basal body complex protein [Lachnospiraceae bacterium]|nr:flagellar hook-basal body complex protein [Lachnospiraceae bacterium]